MASRAPPRRRTAAVPRPRALVRPPRAAHVPGRAPTPSPWRPATPPRARARSRTARRRRPSPPVAIAQRRRREASRRARTASTARAAVRRTIATGPVAGDRASKLFARARVVRWCASAWRSLRRSSSAPCRSSASDFSTSSRARRSVVIPFSACPGRASSRERSLSAARGDRRARTRAPPRASPQRGDETDGGALRTAPSARRAAVPAAMLRRSAHCACAAASCCRTQSRADSSSAFAVVNPARAFSAGPIASALSDDATARACVAASLYLSAALARNQRCSAVRGVGARRGRPRRAQ